MSTNQQISNYVAPDQKSLLAYLKKAEGSIANALPKHLNPDRMLRLALTCFSQTPKLRGCTANSILGSIIVASQLGLEPGVNGQGYLIPYKTTCTFVPGWQGLVGLLNNSGRATAWTGAVFDGDVWEFELGSNPRCRHIPGPNFGIPEKMTWVYACGKVNGSEQPVVEAWPMARVWAHRDRFNKVGNQHYSYTHPEMYARKVVLLQVLKYMPRSIELSNAMVAANAAEESQSVHVAEGGIVEVDSQTVETSGPQFEGGNEDPLVRLDFLMGGDGVSVKQLSDYCAANKLQKGQIRSQDDLTPQLAAQLVENWDHVLAAVRGGQA